MPKYLLQVKYTAEGARGVTKDGGTKRKAAAQALVQSLGGTLETMYFAFGAVDVFAIAELPDNAAAAAASMAVGQSGAASARIVPLLTPAEIDQASKKSPGYTAPGH